MNYLNSHVVTADGIFNSGVTVSTSRRKVKIKHNLSYNLNLNSNLNTTKSNITWSSQRSERCLSFPEKCSKFWVTDWPIEERQIITKFERERERETWWNRPVRKGRSTFQRGVEGNDVVSILVFGFSSIPKLAVSHCGKPKGFWIFFFLPKTRVKV